MADELYDFGSSFATTVAPAVTSMGFSAGMAAAGPLGIAVGVLGALGGRSKRRRRRRQARANKAAQQVQGRGEAQNVGRAAGQQAGSLLAAGSQMGGTIAGAAIQTRMADAFLSQQRILKGVGLTRRDMTRSRDKALARERARKANEERKKQRSQGNQNFAYNRNRTGNA